MSDPSTAIKDTDKADDKEKRQAKELADLLGDDTISECDCEQPREPCGIPDEATSTISECPCDDLCDPIGNVQKESKVSKKTTFSEDHLEITGKLQSPINIDSKKLVVKNYPALVYCTLYCEVPCRMLIIRQDNYEVYLKYESYASPRITGGPLKTPYKLIKFQFHWAAEANKGSDHTIDGKPFVLELHAVHIEEKLKKEMANLHKNGYAIIAYFFELGDKEHPAIAELLDSFQRLDAMEVSKNELPYIEVRRLFPVTELFDLFSDSYLTYEGSLTWKPYAENVTWILAPYCIKVSAAQMARFRSLKLVKANNFREAQEQRGRVIYRGEREDYILRKAAAEKPANP